MLKNPVVWTYADLSAKTGVPATTLRQWRVRGKLPEPDLVTQTGPGWFADGPIRKWVKDVAVAGPHLIDKRTHRRDA